MKFKKGDIIRNTSFIHPDYMSPVPPGHLFVVLGVENNVYYQLNTPDLSWFIAYTDPCFKLVENPSELLIELLTPNRIE